VDRFVVISGCSGGGKSTLLAELGRRGHAIVEEPGRRIVKEELKGEGAALPWVDETAFARRVLTVALADRASAGALDGWVFFDRGLFDAGRRASQGPAMTIAVVNRHFPGRLQDRPPGGGG
jgi:predicted ATPase